MTSPELENLTKIGKLKREAFSRAEFQNFLKSGSARLRDAENVGLSMESRFDLAYNAAHAFALAALRVSGYRSEQRYVVFQALEHTVQFPQPQRRVLIKAHGHRNDAEYEGAPVDDAQLLAELISTTQMLEQAVRSLSLGDAAQK